MKLQPWLNPGHKHQQGNPDRSKDNSHKVGPENHIYLYGYLRVARWLWEVVWLLNPTNRDVSVLLTGMKSLFIGTNLKFRR
jgi:hypothetical protein